MSHPGERISQLLGRRKQDQGKLWWGCGHAVLNVVYDFHRTLFHSLLAELVQKKKLYEDFLFLQTSSYTLSSKIE